MKKILLATTNPGKRQEILSALLPIDGLEFVTLSDMGITTPVDETGNSYGENALLKAQAYFQLSGLPVIAEDSGMEVAALKDELGVNTRGWGAGANASDEEWLHHFMDRMQQEEERAARFVCHAIYMDEQGHQSFEGDCVGIITHDVSGPIQKGIPLSSVFQPIGVEKVYSAMSEEEKNQLSHRGKAMKHLRQWLLTKIHE
jgi:XTP/dITP diphosphohydrolase